MDLLYYGRSPAPIAPLATGPMRALALLVLLASSYSASAQPLDGSYRGSISGTPATLTLHQDAAGLRGTIDAGGYGYTLAGTADGTADGTAHGATASGTLTDPQAGSVLPFELAVEGDGLTLTVVATDPYGEAQRIPFTFQRSSAAGPPPAGAATGTALAEPIPASNRPSNVERDPALIGRWGYSDTYISGDFSSTTRLSLQINPDGTYLYGNGSVSAGGANDYGSYDGRSSGGDVTQGEWRTTGNVVYVKEPGTPGWTPYARYYVEGGRMLFTFNDGSRQSWTRQ